MKLLLEGSAFAVLLLVEWYALSRLLLRKGSRIMGQLEDAVSQAESAASSLAASMQSLSSELDADVKAIAWAAQQASTPDPALVQRLQAHAANMSQLASSAQALAAAHANDAPAQPAPAAPAASPSPAPASPAPTSPSASPTPAAS